VSSLTAEGRKKARDHKLDGVYRTLRLDKGLKGLSRYQRGTLAELKLIGRNLFADIRRRGVMLPDGTVNPAVEAHRKNAHEQLYSLSVYAEVNRAHQAEPLDLVAAMAAQADTAEPAEVEKAESDSSSSGG
jgi:hypothetical protein